MPKTRDVPRTQNARPQPPPEPQPQKEAQPAQPKPTELPGDTKFAKLDTSPEKTEAKPDRPRTLKEARAQQSNLFPSREMQQDGGSRRMALQPSFDAKATPFGDYDRRFIDAVTQRWYDLLDSQKFAQDRSGKVTLRFHLNYDGTISNMEVLENTVGDLLGYVCQESVTDPPVRALAVGHAADGRCEFSGNCLHLLLLLKLEPQIAVAKNIWTHLFTSCWR